jgi:2-desacetyl-2-hydroxyethyl bacteriochlorophyllide A dehydrogenase
MKAIVHRSYGSPDVLKCEEAEMPAPGDDEVLIRVRAASLNALDWHLIRATPFPIRLMAGPRKPKKPTPGCDLAGEVASVGKNVTEFKAGDAVFGCGSGTFAEYVCTSASRLAAKPANISFEQAAAVPLAGLTALQGLRRVQPGQRVLINGAGGGVGTFAVQIAKAFGAHVSGVCGTHNVEMVRSIGAERVFDYTREDFTRSGEAYDVIFDIAGNHPFSALRRVLTPNGIVVAVGRHDIRGFFGWFVRVLCGVLLSRFTRQKRVIHSAKMRKEDLTALRDLIEAGKVAPVIDRRYALSEAAEAVRYFAGGHVGGKVVVTMAT